jgi:hypothetical protein
VQISGSEWSDNVRVNYDIQQRATATKVVVDAQFPDGLQSQVAHHERDYSVKSVVYALPGEKRSISLFSRVAPALPVEVLSAPISQTVFHLVSSINHVV